MYEVFWPRSGRLCFRTRYRWLAALAAWYLGLDYAREGEGWLREEMRHGPIIPLPEETE
jgi:hypothetical protein